MDRGVVAVEVPLDLDSFREVGSKMRRQMRFLDGIRKVRRCHADCISPRRVGQLPLLCPNETHVQALRTIGSFEAVVDFLDLGKHILPLGESRIF